MENKTYRTYIGDAVYVEFDGYYIRLSTTDGERDSNVIFLEPPVLANFEDWLSRLRASQSATPEAESGR